MKIMIINKQDIVNHRLIIITLFLFIVSSIYGQRTSQGNDLRKSLDYMFAHLDKSSVPTGLLRDYAVEYEDLDLFSGNTELLDDNFGTLVRYGDLLKTISSAAVFENSITDFENKFLRYENSKEPGLLNLSVMLYKYARIKANALTDGLIRYEKGQVYNTKKAGSPYQIESVFAGCCLNTTSAQSNVTFLLPPSLLLSNCDIQQLELDYGAGYQKIMVNLPIKATLKKGTNKLTIKATLQNGKVLYAHTLVDVIESPILTRTRSSTTSADYEWTTQGKDFDGVSTSAEISIAYANGRRSLQKPLIIVEGFDPRVSKDQPRGAWNFNDNVRQNRQIYEMTYEDGYDIVYVDWKKSEEYIQANAYTLIEVIKQVNQMKNNSGSQEPNVIIGHSMGGLIARYALKTMENRGIRHQTSSYISYDAPHLGAHIPLGVLYGFHGVLEFIESRGLVKTLLSKYSDMDEYLNLAKSQAYATSAQQMLVNFVDPAGNFNNQEHIHWQKELNALGFPKGDMGESFTMLTVANGNYDKPVIPSHYIKANLSAGSDIVSYIYPKLSAVAVGIGLNDIIAGALTLLPGRDAIDGIAEIYPAKAIGDPVTHIKIKYIKTFLWIAPISREIFSYDKRFLGAYLFDTYPSSTFGIPRDNFGAPILQDSGGFPLIYDYEYDFKRVSVIPFIPTSSALAFGDGLSMSVNNFFTAPKGLESPFGENYFIHEKTEHHQIFTKAGLGWIRERLSNRIVGPKIGYEGAQYNLSSALGAVTWHSSNSQIASINSSGILSVKGKGVVLLTARYKEASYSQMIMVGMPRYILSASHEPGGYKIQAECIDDEFKDYLSQMNGVLNFNWGIKYPDKEIRWIESDEPNLIVQIQGQNEKVTIFFETVDALGNKSILQHTDVNSQDIYDSQNQKLYIDSQGELYKENKRKYSYESARLYLDYKNDLADKYYGREWMPISAMVLSPFGGEKRITVENGGPLIRDILPESELELIKNSTADNETYVYTVILLNFKRKAIQFIPVSFTYKIKI